MSLLLAGDGALVVGPAALDVVGTAALGVVGTEALGGRDVSGELNGVLG